MVIAVDFDGTIVEHAYPKIGKDIPFAFEVLKMLQQDRHQLILWTIREGDMLQEAVEYCRSKGLEFYAVNNSYPDKLELMGSRKVNADLFIDDRNLGGLPEWGIIYRMIKGGTPYSPHTFETDVNFDKPKKKKSFWDRL